VAGIIAGPFVVNLVSPAILSQLKLIDQIALSLIALTAGGEFRYQTLRRQIKPLFSILTAQIIIVIGGTLLLILLLNDQLFFLRGEPFSATVGVGLLFGILAITMSPATTIAIITETRAKGKFTEFILGMVIFVDIAVIILFSLIFAISKPLILGSGDFQSGNLLFILREISFSIGAGILAGFIITAYLKYVGKRVELFLLGFVLFGIEFSTLFHLELILMFVAAGFFVQNFSDSGHRLILGIEKSSLPVYVVFFALTGSALNFQLFFQYWILALVLVVSRLVLIQAGTFTGGILAKTPEGVPKYGWMGFAGQAGVSLGLAILIEQNIPGLIGSSIKALVVASIAINQILGPILFRYSLVRVKEAGSK
jgi:Kef-type K+ transport system membrane component KefB